MPLTVLYGTETGCARDVAERIASLAVATGFRDVAWDAMDAVPVSQWRTLPGPLVLVCSTTGQGDTPATMLDTWNTMLQVDCPPVDGLRFAVFGLGDSTYAKFNFQAKMLHNRLVQLGGSPIVHRGLGDEQDGNGHDEALGPWLVDLWPKLAASLPEDEASFVRTEFRTFKLEQQPEGSEKPVTMAFVPSVNVRIVDEETREQHAPTEPLRRAGFDLTVRKVTRLTAEDHFQNVSQIDFERPSSADFAIEATDAIGMYPSNDEADVEFLAAKYGNPTVIVGPNTTSYRRQPATGGALTPTARPLAQVLRENFDLHAAARRGLFLVLAAITNDPDEVERFTELATVVPEYDRFCWREKRTTAEVLRDFPLLVPPLADLLSVLTPLQPRWYSVASDPADQTTVSLCVALLEFATPFKRKRYGTCSRQLMDSTPGQVWRGVQIRKGQGIRWPPRIESSDATANDADQACGRAPLVLIGPGTGIAPCRALWWAALARGTELDVVVYTGNRDRAKDFLYAEELQRLSDETKESPTARLAHHMALSRENPKFPSMYVQHAMVKNAAEIAAALQHPDSVFFVSGNAKRMPQDVEDTLTSIIQNRIPAHAANPAKYLRMLKQTGRLVMDTWA